MNNPQPSPQQEYDSALQAFKQNDLPHAIFHLAYALQADPTNQQWRELLDKIIKKAGNKAGELVQPDENQGMHFSHGAVLAYIQASQGDINMALGLLSQVHGAIPENIYVPWVVEWLQASEKSGGLFKKADPLNVDTVTTYLMRDMQKYTSGNPIPDPIKAYYNQMLPALEKVREQNQDHAFYHAIFSSLLRRIGYPKKALEYAMRGHQLQPHQLTALMVALVYREQQDFDTALDWYRTSLQHNPTDVATHLDIADMFIHMNRRADAIDYYRRATRLEPDQPWATPHLYYYSYFEEKDPQHLEDLKTYAEQHPDNQLAMHLYQRLQAYINMKPYVNYIPTPAEAGLNALLQIDEQLGEKTLKSEDFKLTLSLLESPSVSTVFERYFIEEGGEEKPDFTIIVSDIQQPDPRQPISKVPYLLWTYDGKTPVKNLPAPSPKLAEAVGKIAVQEFEIDRWQSLAQQLAGQLTEKHIQQLLAVMLYPPQSQPPHRVWDWVYRVQLASALTIAYIGEDWEKSERRKALISLAFGPMDWTIDAGLFALAKLAQADPNIAGEVVKVYRRVYGNMPSSGHISYIYALTELGLKLPSLPSDFRQQLEQLKRDWFD